MSYETHRGRQGRCLGATIVRAQRGDHAAFEYISNRFADALFRSLYARTGEASVSEDLLGELWVRVVEHLPGFRSPERPAEVERAFSGWLYRLAYNLVIDHARRQRPGL